MLDRFAARMMYEASLAQPRYQQRGRLTRHGWKAFSQNDEDGLIHEIFRRIGVSSKQFVEIGVSDGLECNTTALLLDGWTGTWIESSPECTERANKLFTTYIEAGLLSVVRDAARVSGIDALFELWGISNDVDLLSIDIDGNDYWLWRAIENCRPRLVVIEYNAAWPPPMSITVKQNEDRRWNETSYFGASLKALEILGQEKGYALVGCCYAGVNAFFVREDLLGNDLFCAPFTAENHFEPPRYDLGSVLAGHPVGVGPVERVAGSPSKKLEHDASDCRLCAGPGLPRFRRTVLGRHRVAYFQCQSCGSLYTERPYWLGEAYSFPGVHIDIGMAHRAVRNWIALALMLPSLGFSPSDLAIDYGGGTGLMTRLLRDAGFNFLTFDRFRSAYFSDFYQASSIDAYEPRLITAFEVFEHFSEPRVELAAILEAGAELIIFSTSFYEGQNPETWDYLVPECGQHVFFYSREGFEMFCRDHGYIYIHGTFLQALVKRGSLMEEREQEVERYISRWDLPNEDVAALVQYVIRGNDHISREAVEARERFLEMISKPEQGL